MNNNARLAAINGLAKTAGAMPQPMIKMSAAYMAGFRKAAEDAGVDPAQLVKLAWTPSGLFSGALGAVGNSLVSGFTGNGFGKGWKEGWQWGNDFGDALQDEIYSSNTLKNLGSGVASLGNGFMSGVMNAPGFVTGAVGALGKGVYSGLTGNGFINGVKGGWRAGQDFADNLGIGDWDLKHAKRRVNKWQTANMHDYMRRNGIDSTQELSRLDRWALNGMGISNAAGAALGEIAAFNAGGKVLGGVNKLRNLRKPPSTPGVPGAAPATVPTPAPAAPAPAGPYELTINGVPIDTTTFTPITTAANTASTAANTANAARTAASAASTASNTASTASNTVGLGRRMLNTARNVGTKLKKPAGNAFNDVVGTFTVEDGIGHRRTTVNNLRNMYGKAYNNNTYTPSIYNMNNLSAKVRF